jgi:hypothetical protein
MPNLFTAFDGYPAEQVLKASTEVDTTYTTVNGQIINK